MFVDELVDALIDLLLDRLSRPLDDRRRHGLGGARSSVLADGCEEDRICGVQRGGLPFSLTNLG
jgi:hypothetical protein